MCSSDLVTDIRGGQTFDGLFDALHELHRMGCAYKILFVEASVETIIKRYKETRRMHPLSSTHKLKIPRIFAGKMHSGSI